MIQKAFIDSGRIGYQCVDDYGEAGRSGDGCCCIHAVTDMDPVYGRGNYPLIWYGDAGSEPAPLMPVLVLLGLAVVCAVLPSLLPR